MSRILKVLLSGFFIIIFYFFVKPIAFLFITGIILCILFLSFITEIREEKHRAIALYYRKISLISTGIFVFLFILSLVVLRNYQIPSGDTPYFNNAQHTAVRNYGLAFDGKLPLFSTDKSKSLWNCEQGSLIFNPRGEQGPGLELDHFNLPVFKKSKTRVQDLSLFKKSVETTVLLNPVYKNPVKPGFIFRDAKTSLEWTSITKTVKDEVPVFEMSLIFKSSDSILLNNYYRPGQVYTDTLIIDSLSLKKGLSLTSVIDRANNAGLGINREIVKQWLDRFSDLQLLTIFDQAREEYNLTLFYGNPHSQEAWAEISGNKLTPISTYAFPADSTDLFHVGLGNAQQQFLFRKLTPDEKQLSEERDYLIEFRHFNWLPVSNIGNDETKIGSVEVYFLKNAYTQLGIEEIRKGLLFNQNINDNGLTNINGLFEFAADNTGKPLLYKIQSLGRYTNVSQNNRNFSLKSGNGKATWLFELTDFSKNPFDFRHLVIYLSILTFLIIVLLVITPGREVIYIETPALIVLYLLYVFRLLLLWRVATFPPFENITLKEFNNLRHFDFSSLLSLPISFLLITACIISILIFRLIKNGVININWRTSSGDTTSPKKIYSSRIQFSSVVYLKNLFQGKSGHFNIGVFFLLLLIPGVLLSKFVPEVMGLPRILGIVYPIVLYLYFSNRVFLLNYRDLHKRDNGLQSGNYLNRLSESLLSDTSLWLSLFTLMGLLISDRGFAIIFLFFLLFKSIIFNFSYAPQHKQSLTRLFFHPDSKWVFAISSALIVLLLIFYKGFFDFLLSNKYLLLQLLLIVICILLFYKKTINRYLSLIPLLALTILLFVPQIRDYIDSKANSAIKHVIFRTSILYRPVEELLFDNEYNSFNERKIIETAQSQWFINSYLNPDKTAIVGKEMINLRPHFNKGVSYLTQTRDVVLPRYIISEFGVWVMLLLIALILTPLLIYFFSYRLVYNRILHADTGTGAMCVILLFTTGFTVWLTSTNRFVFFGQDFPFISIASIISSLVPLILLSGLLLTKPAERYQSNKGNVIKWLPWSLGILCIASALYFSGGSRLIEDEKFEINFSAVENRVNTEINSLFQEAQLKNSPQGIEDFEALQNRPDELISKVSRLLDILFKEKKFETIYQQSTLYEKTMLNKLRNNPAMGFELSSPLHLRIKDKKLSISFNRYFHVELPAYEYEKEWKGDIRQEDLTSGPVQDEPVFTQPVSGNAGVIIVPGSYFPDNVKRGLFNLYSSDPGLYTKSYIYDGVRKNITQTTPASFVEVLDSSDIAFLTDSDGSHILNYTINSNSRPYFAYSFRINGRQQHIYPLGKSFYWIRHWTEANKQYYKSKQFLEANSSLAIDYKLTDSVNSFLQTRLKEFKKELPRMNFSVVAADGNGKLRLLADFDMRREIIDPNDGKRISEKEKDEYFIIDNENERMQWGNINLMRMKHGPGSSIKPVVLAASASQLRLEWEQLKYLKSEPNLFQMDDGQKIVRFYAGLNMGPKGWKVLESAASEVDLTTYLKKSDNLYHSLVVFLSSYERARFPNLSFTDVLKAHPVDSLSQFPKIGIGNSKPYYLPRKEGWPVTDNFNHINSNTTYFGNTKSLMAKGLDINFSLRIQSPDKYGYTTQKSNISSTLPETLTHTSIWSFPEESFFIQEHRTANTLKENFDMGLRNPTLGGSPYMITPVKMLELYGKLATLNNQYKVLIDANTNPVRDWNYDSVSWGPEANYRKFIADYVYKGMKEVFTAEGTASSLLQPLNKYKGYHFYGKTGTIDGTTNNDNSKRLAMIISKNPLQAGLQDSANRFFIVYFTIGDAFKTKDPDDQKKWFWNYYRKILDYILSAESFKNYMNE